MTDLVGSTGLESRVGPAHAHELRAEYFGLLRAAIADSGGREVKNTGDGLMLVFASPSSAVACAVAMQQRMEKRNRSATERLIVRIGISAGEATVEDGDYFGMPSIEAARLCEQAPGEGILVSQLVRLMAASRSGDFESVGALALKGIPDPVEAFSVAWTPVAAVAGAGLPLPTALSSFPAVGFVGRERERALIEDWSREAREGSGRAIFLAGEPGIGKTRLATRAALEAHVLGSAVCWGTAIEDLGAPYAAWIQALSHYVEHAPEEVLRAHVERHAGELSRLVRALGRRVPEAPAPQESDPDTERFLLFTAVAGLLEEACAQAPVTLVLDDLQWADKQTLALMRHVIAAGEHLPLLVIGIYRDSDLDRGHPLGPMLADLHRVPGVHRLTLDGLRVQDVAAVMEGASGREMGEPGRQLAQEIAQETAGNPFFVTEILRHLTESGAISEGEDGRWTLHASIAELGLPQSVREVVVRRVRRLGELCEEALNVAAVVGRTFDVELLVRLGAGEEDELYDALDRAVASSVLTESPDRLGRFTFAHAIIDHTLYEALSANRRARLHRRVAEVLEELGSQDPDRLPELAYHWYAAGNATDPDRAIESARRAGAQALTTLAPDEAMRWFAQALELLDRHQAPPDSGEAESALAARRAQLLVGLGSAQTRAGDGLARATLLDAAQAARTAEDSELLASVALSFGAFALSPGIVDEQLVSLLDEALLAVEEADSALRVRLLTRLAVALYWSDTVDRREALVERAIAMARRLGDSEALAYALGHGQLATRTPDTTERGLAWIAELLTLAPPRSRSRARRPERPDRPAARAR